MATTNQLTYLCFSPVCLFTAGVLKLVALILVFLLAVFLTFQLLEINMEFKLGNAMCEYSFKSCEPKRKAAQADGSGTVKRMLHFSQKKGCSVYLFKI